MGPVALHFVPHVDFGFPRGYVTTPVEKKKQMAHTKGVNCKMKGVMARLPDPATTVRTAAHGTLFKETFAVRLEELYANAARPADVASTAYTTIYKRVLEARPPQARRRRRRRRRDADDVE